ncbi:hypothetical protein [Sporosarcina cyprini]|uniref:hypothetical protein n=1 Tax=Sporosarcina cyprini TaxID=2910523 RepID=UPI001EE13098|nr:hypothetical protein [Sporosarcina cyprini]MCG3087674.1 hypothetical protein [Sporosarcina cyprini]
MKQMIITIVFMMFFIPYVYLYLRQIIKMNQTAVFPVTEEDVKAIRRQPKAPIGLMGISHQKIGLYLNGSLIALAFLLEISKKLGYFIDWTSLSFILPGLINYNQTWNVFAIMDDGVLCGGRFVPWKRMQSYEFEPINKDHRYYGYVSEVNSGYELEIKTKLTYVNCIVTSEEAKEKLSALLDAHLVSKNN